MYIKPTLTDLGSIAQNTFDNPGHGDMSSGAMHMDMFGEHSHPFAS